MSATPAITFGSVCSGIEAASVAWAPLGWRAAWLAEVDPFACAVLAHHYPDVPNLGDMTTIAARVLAGSVPAPDVLCGGTPCQAFSVAGLRRSLADERGNLSLKFVELANAIDHVRARSGKPASVVFWENVPGVLSTGDNAFGCFLAGLAGEDEPLQPPGGRWTNAGAVYGPRRAVAWRVLDAQYFGLAQRRRRVFVVASTRNGFDPAEVLFEWHGLRRDSAPRREAGQGAAGTIGGGPDGGSISGAVTSKWAKGSGGPAGDETYNMVAHTLRGSGFDASEDGTGRGTPLVAMPIEIDKSGGRAATVSPTLDRGSQKVGRNQVTPAVLQPMAFDDRQITDRHNRSNPQPDGPCHTLPAHNSGPALAFPARLSNQTISAADLSPTLEACNPTGTLTGARVRRLTTEECEALQGFPRGHTRIAWRGRAADDCPDGPRYRALGNSWPVPVVAWIGRRMARHMGQHDA